LRQWPTHHQPYDQRRDPRHRLAIQQVGQFGVVL